MFGHRSFVIPAKAGIQTEVVGGPESGLDPRFRGDDDCGLGPVTDVDALPISFDIPAPDGPILRRGGMRRWGFHFRFGRCWP